jgi:hypothetical protein
MTDIHSGENASPSRSASDAKSSDRRIWASRAMSMYVGLILLSFSALVLFGIYKYVTEYKPTNGFYPYEVVGIVIALLTSLISIIMGVRLMLRDATSERVVIPNEDRALLEDLIRSGNEKGIDQYVRLSSLSGTTGTATKLGLTGLPLATVGLTVFFSLVAIFGVDGFLDLAKLTLGAFIGSFVQKNISGDKATNDGIRIYNSNSPEPTR